MGLTFSRNYASQEAHFGLGNILGNSGPLTIMITHGHITNSGESRGWYHLQGKNFNTHCWLNACAREEQGNSVTAHAFYIGFIRIFLYRGLCYAALTQFLPHPLFNMTQKSVLLAKWLPISYRNLCESFIWDKQNWLARWLFRQSFDTLPTFTTTKGQGFYCELFFKRASQGTLDKDFYGTFTASWLHGTVNELPCTFIA